jgi:hypothetical protein
MNCIVIEVVVDSSIDRLVFLLIDYSPLLDVVVVVVIPSDSALQKVTQPPPIHTSVTLPSLTS